MSIADQIYMLNAWVYYLHHACDTFDLSNVDVLIVNTEILEYPILIPCISNSIKNKIVHKISTPFIKRIVFHA